jgi:hypothetical protein
MFADIPQIALNTGMVDAELKVADFSALAHRLTLSRLVSSLLSFGCISARTPLRHSLHLEQS